MTLAGAVLSSSVLHTNADGISAVLLAAGAIFMVFGFIIWLGQILRR